MQKRPPCAKRPSTLLFTLILLLTISQIKRPEPAALAAPGAIERPTQSNSPIRFYDRYQAVYFRGDDNHLYQLRFENGRWIENQLTRDGEKAAGDPFPFNDGRPILFYRGEDNHIHRLSQTTNGWERTTLTTQPFQLASGDPTAYSFGGIHILYRGLDAQLHELVVANNAVNHTILAFGADPTIQGNPVGWVDGTRNIVYRGHDNHLNWLRWSAAGNWERNRLTFDPIPPAAGDPYLHQFGVPHLLYRGTDNQIHEFVFENLPTYYQLSFGDEQMAAGDPVGYGFIYDAIEGVGFIRGQHVLYRGIDNRLNDLFFLNNSWTHAVPTPEIEMVGDPAAHVWETDRVVYRDTANQIQELVWVDKDWSSYQITGPHNRPLAGDPAGLVSVRHGIPPQLPLRHLAAGQGRSLGVAVNRFAFNAADDRLYREVLAREFNMVTAENVMKFEHLQPTQDAYDFRAADELIAFAEANDMQVRGHTLVWHNQLPDWLEEGVWSREELIAILEEHISTVVGRYRGRVDYWDVVNEAMDDHSGTLRNTFWLDGIGPDYVDIAFQAARAADPDAVLYYNDYGAEALNGKSNAIYDMVEDMVLRGIPIDGVGFQMHTNTDHPPPNWSVLANIDRLAELGLEVQFTEMDVRTTIGYETLQTHLSDQAVVYNETTEICLARDACTGLSFWGFTDRYSWIYGAVGTSYPTEAPLLFTPEYEPKEAYYAVQSALGPAPSQIALPFIAFESSRE